MTRYDRRGVLKRIGTAASLVVSASLAGCGGGGGGNGGGNGDDGNGGPSVDMTDDLVYDPETITITTGETVTWENVGSVGHTVTAYDDGIPDGADYFASGGFDSEQAARDNYTVGDSEAGDIVGGETYEHTFEVAGTYEYFCIPHEASEMTGTVEVQEG